MSNRADPEISPSFPEYWAKNRTDPRIMPPAKRVLYKNYLCRARKREFIGRPPNAHVRNAAYTRFALLRDLVMNTWDCTEIHRSTYGKTGIPQSEFKILDGEGNPMMTILAKKQYRDSWNAGAVFFDSGEFGKKTVWMEAVSNVRAYWRMIFWEELMPFIDDVKSIKVRLEGFSKPNTSVLCLADYAKCLGLQVTAGQDRFYLLEYNVLVRVGKDGMFCTDSPKFPRIYAFGQMCHILNLIAGKPDIKLPE